MTQVDKQRLAARLGVMCVVTAVLIAVIALVRPNSGSAGEILSAQTAVVATTAAPAEPAGEITDEPLADGPCVLEANTVGWGDSGADVECLQRALIDAGLMSGPATGEFDNATFAAVEAVQKDHDLWVDGVVGRDTALALGVWRDEALSVVRTPPPPPGAEDLWGFPLSSVASAGPDAPPLPPNSGSGRRLVYEREGQRVWAVGDDGAIIRSWLVSGSQYENEVPGTHEVYSRSEMSTGWNGKAWLPLMVRWMKTDIGAIGFHSLPLHVEDDSPYQTEAELGTRLSGGCQRQARLDAEFTWAFAEVGTKVVVL